MRLVGLTRTPRLCVLGGLSALAVVLTGCSGSSGGGPATPTSPTSTNSSTASATPAGAFFAKADAVCAHLIPGEIAAGAVAGSQSATPAEQLAAADVLQRGLDNRFKGLSALMPPAAQTSGYQGFLSDYGALVQIEDLSVKQAHAVNDHTKPPLTKARGERLLRDFQPKLADLRSYATANGLTHCVADEVQ
jgi:hypothetical protein